MKKNIFFILPLIFSFGCRQDVNLSSFVNDIVSESENIESVKKSNLSSSQLKLKSEDLRDIYSRPSSSWPKPEVDPGVEFKEISNLPPVKFPSDNIYNKSKSELGKMLFFDKRLSGSKELSCSSCHKPEQGWSDNLSFSNGHNGIELKRHSPSIINNAYNTTFFWDGRAKSLEQQAEMVITNPNEMHMTPETVEQTLNNIPVYKQKFKEAFNSENVKFEMVTKAIATFERTIVTKNQSPFDLFLKGNKNALSDSAVRGLHLFRTQARCMNCHSGPNFTDNKFHNLSLTYVGTEKEDLGRYNITKDPKDWGVFKTPTLRNSAETSPFMHNGVFGKMSKILTLYNGGMHGKDENKSPLLHQLNLTDQDLIDLEEFIKSLSEKVTVN